MRTRTARRRVGPEDRKLQELILFICERSEGDPGFGATKLNKLLFFSDFQAYLYLGRSITGGTYQALAQGPAPRRLVPVRDRLKNARQLGERRTEFHGRIQHRLFALRDPDLSAFSADEIALVDRVIREFWGRTAADLTSSSHRFLGWRVARLGEDIRYETALIGDREPTSDEVRYAATLARDAVECLGRE